MSRFRGLLVPLMISGLIGCQSPQNVTVSEYRPKLAVVTEKKAPDSAVFELVGWTPIAPLQAPVTQPVAAAKPPIPPRQMPVEVEQVYVTRGTPLGFQRTDRQLIAIAGPTTMPLQEAHYEWRTASIPNAVDETRSNKFNNVVADAVGVVIIVGAVVGVLWLIHVDRHSLLDDLFNNDD